MNCRIHSGNSMLFFIRHSYSLHDYLGFLWIILLKKLKYYNSTGFTVFAVPEIKHWKI